eukprot:2851401-Karenia_brevis.AAC.1
MSPYPPSNSHNGARGDKKKEESIKKKDETIRDLKAELAAWKAKASSPDDKEGEADDVEDLVADIAMQQEWLAQCRKHRPDDQVTKDAE